MEKGCYSKNFDFSSKISFAKKAEKIKELIEKGYDVNTKNQFGMTLLHFASDVEATKLLLDNGADVNAVSNAGKTL